MIRYDTLENIEMEQLYKAFLVCFDDYIVNINLPYDEFLRMIKRRNYHPQLSIAVFDDNKIVGFILNGYRIIENEPTLYDIATAVSQDYRKQGIMTNMLQLIRVKAAEKDVKYYTLEVIQENITAYDLYVKQGFSVARSFVCFTIEKENLRGTMKYEVVQIDRLNWEEMTSFWDFTPSWQNAIASIQIDQEHLSLFIVRKEAQVIGYCVVDCMKSEIMQFAVDHHYRKCGVGTSLFIHVSALVESNTIRIINVDESNQSVLSFLEKIGFTEMMKQYEMIMNICE